MREENIKALMDELKKIKEGIEKLKGKASLKRVVSQVEEVLRHKHGRRLIGYKADEKDGRLSYWIKEESIKIEEALDGVYILRTEEQGMSAKEVIEAYKDLTDVERAFRTMKSALQLRPFYHWTEDRVRAHALICYLAFLIERYVERTLKHHNVGFSAETAFESLSQLGAAVMEVDEERYTYISEPSRRDRIIFNALGLKFPNRCVIEKAKRGM
jgi:transposase